MSSSDIGESKTLTLVEQMAKKFSMDPEELVRTLKHTAFKLKDECVVTDEQLNSLLVVCNAYNLNPFLKEVYAYRKSNGDIFPVVGVDGWNRIANEHSQFDGIEFSYSDNFEIYTHGDDPDLIQTPACHKWIEATLYRKDRGHPIRIREYLDECYRPPYMDDSGLQLYRTAWQSHPKRCLRHKALIQCYRVGLGFVGIYDEDEASRILASDDKSGQKEVKTTVSEEPVSTLPNHVDIVADKSNDFDTAVIDEVIEKLLPRCKDQGLWQGSFDFLKERYKGSEHAYAKSELDKHYDQYKAENNDQIDSNLEAKGESEAA